jgi:hypothetical protein
MSDQEKDRGHHVVTWHAVRQLFEMNPGGTLLGHNQSDFFHKLDDAQARADGVPFPGITGPVMGHFEHVKEDIRSGNASTARPSSGLFGAPDVQREHAIADPKMSAHENVAAIKGFILDQLIAARAAHDAGDSAAEFTHLGRAVHCLEDSYSNAHMFRDPSNPMDPNSPINAVLNFHPASHTNTHVGTFDSVPTVPGDPTNALARLSDQAAAKAIGIVLHTYVSRPDVCGGDSAAIKQAFQRTLDPFFHTSSTVQVLDDKHSAAFQHQLGDHYKNEMSQSAPSTRGHEQNASWPTEPSMRDQGTPKDHSILTGPSGSNAPAPLHITLTEAPAPPPGDASLQDSGGRLGASSHDLGYSAQPPNSCTTEQAATSAGRPPSDPHAGAGHQLPPADPHAGAGHQLPPADQHAGAGHQLPPADPHAGAGHQLPPADQHAGAGQGAGHQHVETPALHPQPLP